jgi:hypothetical protein
MLGTRGVTMVTKNAQDSDLYDVEEDKDKFEQKYQQELKYIEKNKLGWFRDVALSLSPGV